MCLGIRHEKIWHRSLRRCAFVIHHVLTQRAALEFCKIYSIIFFNLQLVLKVLYPHNCEMQLDLYTFWTEHYVYSLR